MVFKFHGNHVDWYFLVDSFARAISPLGHEVAIRESGTLVVWFHGRHVRVVQVADNFSSPILSSLNTTSHYLLPWNCSDLRHGL